MNNAVDFNKVRRRRQRSVTLKRLFVVAGVMLLTGAVIFTYNLLIVENATTGLRDYFESRGGMGFPADLPGGVIRDVTSIGENLAVLNDTNLYIYSKKAKIVQNIQRMTEHTVAVPSDSRVLTFSVGSRGFSVHSIGREMFTQTLELGILCGTMNRGGDFAVIAPVKEFASKVYVYDRYFRQIYSWSSPEYATNVSLSPEGGRMAVNCVSGSEDGVLESLLYLFTFAENRENAEVALTLQDNLCLGLDFQESDRIALLTDKQYMIVDQAGNVTQKYDFGGRQLLAREFSGKQALLLFAGQDRHESELVLLNENLSEQAALQLDEKVLDLAFGADQIYVLTGSGLTGYDLDMKQISVLEQRGILNICLVGERLYYLTYNRICVLE